MNGGLVKQLSGGFVHLARKVKFKAAGGVKDLTRKLNTSAQRKATGE